MLLKKTHTMHNVIFCSTQYPVLLVFRSKNSSLVKNSYAFSGTDVFRANPQCI